MFNKDGNTIVIFYHLAEDYSDPSGVELSAGVELPSN